MGLTRGQGREKHQGYPTPRSLAVGAHGGSGPNGITRDGILLSEWKTGLGAGGGDT